MLVVYFVTAQVLIDDKDQQGTKYSFISCVTIPVILAQTSGRS